jgi:hypothetical protein
MGLAYGLRGFCIQTFRSEKKSHRLRTSGDSDLYWRKVVTLVLMAWVLEEKPEKSCFQAPLTWISSLEPTKLQNIPNRCITSGQSYGYCLFHAAFIVDCDAVWRDFMDEVFSVDVNTVLL